MDTNRLENLRRELAKQGVRFMFAQFTDIHGAAKGKLIPLAHLGDIVSPGAGFSGPLIWGAGLPRNGPRSEYYGRADLSTLQAMPWLPGYARVALDGHVAGEPFADRPGSGLHFHLSLADADGKPLFASDEDGRGLGLSSQAYHFMAGLLRHAPALTALCAPTVNSYKRLMCGRSLSGTSWAPAFIGYGDNNRTVVARVVYQRIEWRLPDSSANPYLALAGVIAAGLDGIDNKLEAPDPVNQDVYEMNDVRRAELGLKILPQNLGEATKAFKADTVLAAALGENFVKEFVALKSAEWMEYSQHVSAWETKRYLDRF